MDKMVEATGLTKTFRRRDGTEIQAVKNIDLTIETGEIFSLLGPNGAGKTTTISMISGLVEPTAGDATIGGFSIRQQPMEAKKLMGVVPQEIALYPELSARQNLAFFGRMYSLRGRELNQRVDEVLEFIDLKDRQHDRVDTFSGGMKRRVNIGVGLLHRPQLVYMDEPTVGIDPQNRRRILDTVFRLRDEYKMTVLYTTHLMEEAAELSDRVGIIDHGEIIALGSQGELTQQVGEEDRLIIGLGAAQPTPELRDSLVKGVEGVSQVEFTDTEDKHSMTVFAKRGRKALPRILRVIEEFGIEIQSVEVREPDLEAVFLHLTGRALRD
jgi:ABC-2 type transport system ATP-binding protein